MSALSEPNDPLNLFKNEHGKFMPDPWSTGDHNLTKDRPPKIYGSNEDGFVSPHHVEWVKAHTRYTIYLKTFLSMATTIHEAPRNNPTSGIEVHRTISGQTLVDAVLYALSFDEIRETGVLNHLLPEE